MQRRKVTKQRTAGFAKPSVTRAYSLSLDERQKKRVLCTEKKKKKMQDGRSDSSTAIERGRDKTSGCKRAPGGEVRSREEGHDETQQVG